MTRSMSGPQVDTKVLSVLPRSTLPDIKRQANTVVAWKTRVYSAVSVDLAPMAALFPQTNLASACLVHLFPLTTGNVSVLGPGGTEDDRYQSNYNLSDICRTSGPRPDCLFLGRAGLHH